MNLDKIKFEIVRNIDKQYILNVFKNDAWTKEVKSNSILNCIQLALNDGDLYTESFEIVKIDNYLKEIFQEIIFYLKSNTIKDNSEDARLKLIDKIEALIKPYTRIENVCKMPELQLQEIM